LLLAARRALGALAAVAVIGLSFWVLGGLIDGLLLVFAGVLFAIFLRGLTGWLSRHTPLREWRLLAAVGVALLALLGVSAWLIAPSLAAQFDELIIVPEAAARLQRRTTSLQPAITIVGQGVKGALTGALGMALATPLTAALLVLGEPDLRRGSARGRHGGRRRGASCRDG